MTNPPGTSFIPQRPTKGKVNPRHVRKIYIVAYLSYVLFFGSALSAAGVFFLNFSVDLQLEKQKQLLALEREKFSQSDIQSIRDLEKRIDIAQERIDNHVSVFSIFEALEESAVQTLNFRSFSFQRTNDEFPLVTFSGDAETFDSVLFQRDVFATNPILAGSVFKEVGVTAGADDSQSTQSIVSFTLEKEVDTSLIGYIPRISNEPVVLEPEADAALEDQESELESSDDIQ